MSEMRKIFAIIGALITGGISIGLMSATQAAYSTLTNATNMTNMSSIAEEAMTGSISGIAVN